MMTYDKSKSCGSAIHMVPHQVCGPGKENPMICKQNQTNKQISKYQTYNEIHKRCQIIDKQNTYSGSNFRTLVVRPPAKEAPRCTARKKERAWEKE